MINKREFISIVSAILEHCELHVTNTLGAGTMHCGDADRITSYGVMVDATGEIVYDFSNWGSDDDAPVLDAITTKSLIVCADGCKIELTCVKEDEDFDLVKFFAVNNRKWEH